MHALSFTFLLNEVFSDTTCKYQPKASIIHFGHKLWPRLMPL